MTITELKDKVDTVLADNSTRAITEAVLRGILKDLIDFSVTSGVKITPIDLVNAENGDTYIHNIGKYTLGYVFLRQNNNNDGAVWGRTISNGDAVEIFMPESEEELYSFTGKMYIIDYEPTV